jgi:nitrate/nitrite-specific signal transduction histidine kinase
MTDDVDRASNALVDATPSAGDSETVLTGGLQASFHHEEEQTHREQAVHGHEEHRGRGRIRRVLDKVRILLDGAQSPVVQPTGLERALRNLLSDVAPTTRMQLRFIITGRPQTLESAIQEQIYLIGREALLNALRHSEATSIEAELEYSPRRLRVLIRDNGRGIEPKVLKPGCDSHCGLRDMFERAKALGARFQIWSRSGSGTEVELSVPFYSRSKHVPSSWSFI